MTTFKMWHLALDRVEVVSLSSSFWTKLVKVYQDCRKYAEIIKCTQHFGYGWGEFRFKVEPFSADPQALFSSRRWFLKPADSALPAPAAVAAAASSRSAPDHAGHRPVLPALLRITQAREHGGGVIASARDIEDRGAAQALRGARVFVSRASFCVDFPSSRTFFEYVFASCEPSTRTAFTASWLPNNFFSSVWASPPEAAMLCTSVASVFRKPAVATVVSSNC